jgi:hypothetical protein
VYHPLSEYYPDPHPNLTACLDLAPNLTLAEIYQRTPNDTSPKDGKVTHQPNTALLSMILCFGTFFIAHWLRSVKTSKYLGKYVSLNCPSISY